MEVLVGPLERVAVGLADAAEVAGDRVRAAEVDVAAVDAARVQGLDVCRSQDLHRGGDSHNQRMIDRIAGVKHPSVQSLFDEDDGEKKSLKSLRNLQNRRRKRK